MGMCFLLSIGLIGPYPDIKGSFPSSRSKSREVWRVASCLHKIKLQLIRQISLLSEQTIQVLCRLLSCLYFPQTRINTNFCWVDISLIFSHQVCLMVPWSFFPLDQNKCQYLLGWHQLDIYLCLIVLWSFHKLELHLVANPIFDGKGLDDDGKVVTCNKTWSKELVTNPFNWTMQVIIILHDLFF